MEAMILEIDGELIQHIPDFRLSGNNDTYWGAVFLNVVTLYSDDLEL